MGREGVRGAADGLLSPILLLDSFVESLFGSRIPRVVPRMTSTVTIVTTRMTARRFPSGSDRVAFSSRVPVTKSEVSSLSLFLDTDDAMLFFVVI